MSRWHRAVVELSGVATNALGIHAVHYLGGVLLRVAGAVGFVGAAARSS